jgi:hypothetical protein
MPWPNEMRMIRELVKSVRRDQRMTTIFPVPSDTGDVFRDLLERLKRADQGRDDGE